MREDGRITLRSYRLAFKLERRIHRIDRFRIPLPYGVPLAALGWGVAVLLGVVVCRGLPVLGGLIGWLPLPVQLIFLPGLGAHLLCRSTQDGRPTHEVLFARAVMFSSAKLLVAFRAAPRDAGPSLLSSLAMVADERGPTLRRGEVRGPAEIDLRHPTGVELRRRRAVIEQADERPLAEMPRIRLRCDERVVIR